MAAQQEHMIYIQEKVNPILESLVTAILLERPEDLVNFMIKWLSEQSGVCGGKPSQVEQLQKTIARLEAREQELLKKLGQGAPSPVRRLDGTLESENIVDEEEDEEDDDDDDDDDVVDDLPEPASYKKGPRSSVSAEAYGDWNKKNTNFVPTVHKKTPEIEARINAKLSSSFLFSSLDELHKSIVVGAMKIVDVEPGEQVIKQGDEGDCLYVIDSGLLDCYKIVQGVEKLVATVGAGDAFGELALLYNCPRAASVKCREQAVLCQLDRETFNNIVKDSTVKKRTLHESFLKSVKIFKNLESYEIMRIADALKIQTFQKGEYVIRQGDPGNEFFMLEEGTVKVTKVVDGEDEQIVNNYGSRDYFGELALLKNEPRAANVIADSLIKVVTLDRRTFKRLLGPLQDILVRAY